MAARRTTGYKRQHGLTLEQENAIDWLVQGKTDLETAEVVGVHRVTVTKWRLYDPFFQAELNARRKALWGTAIDRLRALVPRAIDAIDRGLADEQVSVRTALEVLKLVGLGADRQGSYGSVGIGSDDPTAILDAEFRRRNPAGIDLLMTDFDAPPITDADREALLVDLLAQSADAAPDPGRV